MVSVCKIYATLKGRDLIRLHYIFVRGFVDWFALIEVLFWFGLLSADASLTRRLVNIRLEESMKE